MAYNKIGFILNNLIKIGEFEKINQKYIGYWEITNLKIDREYFDIANLKTKKNVQLILAESYSDSGKYVVNEVIGDGTLFSDSAISNIDTVELKTAKFIKDNKSAIKN